MNEQQIVERLDIIISLLIPKLDTSNLDAKGLALDVLKLCDFDNSVQDMCDKLKKSRPSIDNVLSKLRSKGLVKTIVKDHKTVYVRLK